MDPFCFIIYICSFQVRSVFNASSLIGSGPGQHTERTVALAVGGFAALGFLIVCLLFLKSLLKKRGGKH